MSDPTLDDVTDLVLAAREGDEAAWSALVDRYARLVYAVAIRCRLSSTDAADVSQTVWLRLAENLGRLHEPSRVGAWLVTTTKRECLALIRARARYEPVDVTEMQIVDTGAGPVDQVTRQETILEVAGAFALLTERCREGAHAFNASCGPAQNLIDPVAEYSHSQGQSITGGFVYRGTAIAGLAGRFVFGDFISGRIWSVARDVPPTLELRGGFNSGLQISSFAQEANGELLIIDYGGSLHRLVAGNGTGSSVASNLSQTGCVDAADPTKPATGLIPYQPIAQFWSDGADKTRHLAVPDDTKITIG